MDLYGRGDIGGIVILWDSRVIQLDTFFLFAHTLSTKFHAIGKSINGFITNVYGPSDSSKHV